MESKNKFFAENGTPRSNPESLELWLARLKSEVDKRPLEWIKQMIKSAPKERITAAVLMDQIHSYEDGHVYYDSCCNGEEESEDGTSYQGSVFEEDATAIKDSENSTEARMDDGATNTVVSTSSQDLHEASIQRRALPLGSPNGKNQIEHKTAFQHSDAISERAIADVQATQLLLDNGFDIHADNSKIKDALLWAAENGHEAVVRLLLEAKADVDAKTGDRLRHKSKKLRNPHYRVGWARPRRCTSALCKDTRRHWVQSIHQHS